MTVFGVDTLINTGVAGSLDADINIGDIVISTDAVQHDDGCKYAWRSGRTDSENGYLFFPGR